jgi:hypothetical protein
MGQIQVRSAAPLIVWYNTLHPQTCLSGIHFKQQSNESVYHLFFYCISTSNTRAMLNSVSDDASDFLQKAGFQHEIASIHFAIYFVVAADQANALDLAAHFKRNG